MEECTIDGNASGSEDREQRTSEIPQRLQFSNKLHPSGMILEEEKISPREYLPPVYQRQILEEDKLNEERDMVIHNYRMYQIDVKDIPE